MLSLTRLLSGASSFDADMRQGSGPVVVWKATKTCNLRCVHCYTDADLQRFAGELTTEEAQRMLEDLAAFNVPALVISGGEPFLRPDILDLADYATSLGIAVSLLTNGTLIDTKEAQRMAAIGVTYAGISIDGSEEWHDRARAREGAFRDAMRGIRYCRDAGVAVGIRFTPTKDNISELGQIFRMVEKENVQRLCIQHLVYADRTGYLAGLDPSVEQKREMMVRLIEQIETWSERDRDVDVVTVDNDCDGPFVYMRLRDRNASRADNLRVPMRKNGGNRSGVAVGAIDSFGFVHPDPFTSTHALGSIRERSFSQIWRDPRVGLLQDLRNRKTLLQGRCATCRWLPMCNGNSRARAEAATGDYWESDPACYLLDSEIAAHG